MNTEKNVDYPQAKNTPTDLDAEFLKLYRQLPAAQRKIVRLSVVLSMTTNDTKAVQA